MTPVNSYGRSLEQILALRYPDPQYAGAKFMSEMLDFVLTPEGRRAVADPLALPTLARLVYVLDILHTDLANRGLSIFLGNDEDGPRYLRAGVQASEQIGAVETATYLKSALDLVPSQALEDVEILRRRLAEWEDADENPLDELDDRSRQRIDQEIPDRLRAFVERHRQAFEQEFTSGT